MVTGSEFTEEAGNTTSGRLRHGLIAGASALIVGLAVAQRHLVDTLRMIGAKGSYSPKRRLEGSRQPLLSIAEVEEFREWPTDLFRFVCDENPSREPETTKSIWTRVGLARQGFTWR